MQARENSCEALFLNRPYLCKYAAGLGIKGLQIQVRVQNHHVFSAIYGPDETSGRELHVLYNSVDQQRLGFRVHVNRKPGGEG